MKRSGVNKNVTMKTRMILARHVMQDLHGKSPEEDGTPDVGMEPAERAEEDAENHAGALGGGEGLVSHSVSYKDVCYS